MDLLAKHGTRIGVTLLPLLIALLHATGVGPLAALQGLVMLLYAAGLRATMRGTLAPRMVIVDIDEKGVAGVGRWPWGRNGLAELTDELFARQQVVLLGFEVVF